MNNASTLVAVSCSTVLSEVSADAVGSIEGTFQVLSNIGLVRYTGYAVGVINLVTGTCLYIGELPTLVGATACGGGRLDIGDPISSITIVRLWLAVIFKLADRPTSRVRPTGDDQESCIATVLPRRRILVLDAHVEVKALIIRRSTIRAGRVGLTLRYNDHRRSDFGQVAIGIFGSQDMAAYGPTVRHGHIYLDIATGITRYTGGTGHTQAIEQQSNDRGARELVATDMQGRADRACRRRSDVIITGHADHRLWPGELIGGYTSTSHDAQDQDNRQDD